MNLRPISDWCRHVAVFYDQQGRYVGKKRLKYQEPTFFFLGQAYNFIPLYSSWFKVVNISNTTKYYQYNVGNPNPLNFSLKEKPVISPSAYAVILKTDVLKKLHNLTKKNPLLELLTPRNLIILLVVILIIWFFSSGGSVSDLTGGLIGGNVTK